MSATTERWQRKLRFGHKRQNVTLPWGQEQLRQQNKTGIVLKIGKKTGIVTSYFQKADFGSFLFPLNPSPDKKAPEGWILGQTS